jgi:hypothetical protein
MHFEMECKTVSLDGYLIFDNSVIDKNYSSKIESVRKQWSNRPTKSNEFKS